MLLLLILNQIIILSAVWPPAYKVDLHQNEEFIIGDYDSNEELFNEEDEMIKAADIKKLNLNKEKYQFQLLHKIAKRYNDRNSEKYNKYYSQNNTNIVLEQNDTIYDSEEESVPFQAGFIDNNNQFILNNENKNVYYLNKLTKQLVAAEIKQKREDTQSVDYNYEELNKEYNIEVEKELELNETFNATNIKEHETVGDAVHMMVDFETPKNCTAEEMKGIGFGAIKCAWIDLQKSHTKESRIELLYRIKKILLTWFFIYCAIVLPLWCHKGWCCCCCRCKFCKPRDRIDEVKKYFAESPPGVFIQKDGEVLTYEPNIYEIDAYFKLEKALMSL